MLKPTSDCRTVLIALEANAFARGGDLVDPEGGIGILKFPTGNISADNYSYKSLHFHNFNDRYIQVVYILCLSFPVIEFKDPPPLGNFYY